MKQRNYESGDEELNEQGIWGKLRIYRNHLGSSTSPLSRAMSRMMSVAGKLVNVTRNARFRSEVLTRLRTREHHLQGSTFTAENRYPELFEACRDLLTGTKEPRLLSFGCSTGEEVQSLAAAIPQAEIIGVDINTWCLREAQRKNAEKRCSFMRRYSAEFKDLSDLDAIFCLAVLQRTEHRTHNRTPLETGFTFEKFETEIETLNRKLRPGGLLLIDHADFRFEDTTVAQSYEEVAYDASRKLRRRKLYGKDNILVADEYVASRIFRKRLAQ